METTDASPVQAPTGSSPVAPRSMFRAWLQLVRAPNLFTVPGDPIAGCLLATFGVLTIDVAFAIFGSLCLYVGGLILNDLRDFNEDQRDRPDRPLPAGDIPIRSAWIVAIAAFLLGCAAYTAAAGMRGLLVSGALLIAIASYNCLTKDLPVIGALNMGLCRGLNVYAGGVVAYQTVFPRTTGLLVITGITAAYFAAVTNLARHETRDRVPLLSKIIPVLAALGGVLVLTRGTGPFYSSPATACLACGFLLIVRETFALFGAKPQPLPPRIGALIRIALIFQAAFCVTVSFSKAGWICAIVLLICFPLSSELSRRFYAS